MSTPTARMKDFPQDVVSRIMLNIDIRDIQKFRYYCRDWQRAIDSNKIGFWRARCEALNLLPVNAHSVLGFYADRIWRRIAEAEKRRGEELTESQFVAAVCSIYRTHFLYGGNICALSVYLMTMLATKAVPFVLTLSCSSLFLYRRSAPALIFTNLILLMMHLYFKSQGTHPLT